MSEAKVVKGIAAPALKVFEIIAAFDEIKPGGPVESVRYEGEGIGMQRYIAMAAGLIVERLVDYDAEALTMSYTIVNADSPLPFDDYKATIVVKDNGDDTSTVEWTGTFQARGDEEVAINMATGIYAGGIKAAKIKLGV